MSLDQLEHIGIRVNIPSWHSLIKITTKQLINLKPISKKLLKISSLLCIAFKAYTKTYKIPKTNKPIKQLIKKDCFLQSKKENCFTLPEWKTEQQKPWKARESMMMMRERATEEWRNGNKKKKKTLYSLFYWYLGTIWHSTQPYFSKNI